MIVDCDRCAVRGAACSGCVVTALLDGGPQRSGLDHAEIAAIELFERAGFEVTVLTGPVTGPVTGPGRPAGLPIARLGGRRRVA
jgi:hypothetical protein